MPCSLIAEASEWLWHPSTLLNTSGEWTTAATALTLVAVAEFGDKSQIVCMALAARHHHWPVLWGAVTAFALLNIIAVGFGAVAGEWLPPQMVALLVALLFAGFGLHSLLAKADEEPETVKEKSGHGVFVTTFLMIFLAEFGDKTQIAVAGLGAAESPLPVWLGATAALSLTSAAGIWAGRILLRKVSQATMNRVAGLLFLAFAIVAFLKADPPGLWEGLIQAIRTASV